MIPSGIKASLQQVVRASVAKTKDVVLRGEGGSASNAASAAAKVGTGEPVRASPAVEAMVSDAPGAASQALPHRWLQRARAGSAATA